jgi:hypothetical protein
VRALKILARLLLAFGGLTLVASIASVVVAMVMKPRLPDRSQPGDDELDMVAILGSRDLRSTSTAFRGGRLICWQGAADLDLRGAQLDAAGGQLLVWTIFGGTGVKVPEDWRVDSHGIAVFGGAGCSAMRPEATYDGPVLTVRHWTVFGGLGIVAEPDEEVLAV